ncbi:MAG TPA: peptidylprolyl isomerase [Labilithrix sp.]
MRRAAIALTILACACRGGGGGGDAGTTTTSSASDGGVYDAVAIARAEDMRRGKDVPSEARSSHDVAARRRAARALARIGDASSLDGLLAMLGDEDAEVVGWSAYGLGFACKGHEDVHVKALAARAANMPSTKSATIDSYGAIARAIGRCGAASSEQELRALLDAGGAWREPALLGLGDLASRKKQLGAETLSSLLDAASSKDAPADTAFYALSRIDVGDALATRVIGAAKAALGRDTPARIFAVRALGRAPRSLAKDAAPELARVVTDAKTFHAAERAEAARGLGALGPDGANAAADALATLAPRPADDPDARAKAATAAAGAEFHVLYTLIGSLGTEPPKRAETTLGVLGRVGVGIGATKDPYAPSPALLRRLADLRCSAALGLVRGALDADVLAKCDADGSAIKESARLTVLLRRPLGDRKTLFHQFANSPHLRVREQAVEAIAEKPELGDMGAVVLAEALASKKPGLVATAAEVVHAHPERAMVLAESEKRAALDPRAPPPSDTPAKEMSKDVRRALAAALAEKWPDDAFETRIALLDAAAAITLPQTKAVATAACADANVVVREHAQRALRSIGENVAECAQKEPDAKPAAEIGAVLAAPARVKLKTDTQDLVIVLEPDLAPVTTTRLAALVKSGFYKGIVVHRVVPGFVVQLGDPEGDGYGGSGKPLRCETSPVPFAPLDVGMALAGRDTGSSQFFVTLSRTPHLDGEYTRVGHAEGNWWDVAEGDAVVDAQISE